MLCSFARIGAALLMRVDDVFRRDRQLWIRLQGKDGQRHEVRCDPTLAVYLENGGTLENAAAVANHPSRRTMRRYGRQRDLILRNDVLRSRPR